MNLGFISLGCAKNLVDSEYILGMMADGAITVSSNPALCDVIIINTCGFIESAKKEAIDTILEMAEYKKDRLKKLIVCGCLSQRYKEDLEEALPEVDAFIAIDDYHRLDEILKEVIGDYDFGKYKSQRQSLTKPYTGYLKISDGCDNRCAYCAIPLIRGNCKSYPIEDLVKEAKDLYAKGVKELNVVAQDTTYYGHDLYGDFRLKDLLVALDEIPFKWIRVLYMYPDEIEDELLEVMRDCQRVIPYFDIPIQYGSDHLLKRMNRRGSKALIKERIDTIRRLFPEAVLRTTIIVGFPGETEESFNETLDFITDIGFDSLGSFTYSEEEETLSATYPDKVAKPVMDERYATLMARQLDIVRAKNEAMIGKDIEVLIEGYESLFDRYFGRSIASAPDDVDGKVYIKSAEAMEIGNFYTVTVDHSEDYDLYCKGRKHGEEIHRH